MARMMTHAAVVSLMTQQRLPAILTAPATAGVFCGQSAATAHAASQDTYYPLDVKLSLSGASSCSYNFTNGNFISAVSIVVKMPAIVNVSTIKVNASGEAAGGNKYRAIVMPEAHMIDTLLPVDDVLIRELASTSVNFSSNDIAQAKLASTRNDAADFAAHFCDYTGAQLLNRAEFVVKGKVTQCIHGHWLFIYNELFCGKGQRATTTLGAADPSMPIGGISRSADISKAKKVSALSDAELEIELPLFFGSSECTAFPLHYFNKTGDTSSDADAVQLRLYFNSIQSIVVNSAGLGNEAMVLQVNTSATPAAVQTITVPSAKGVTSAVATHMLNRTAAPTKDDFSVSDFTVGLRVREIYVDIGTLTKSASATYRVVVPQPFVSQVHAHSANPVRDDAMVSNSAPVHSIYVTGCLLEHVVSNKLFNTDGPRDQLTGITQSNIGDLQVNLGGHLYASDTTATSRTRRTQMNTCTNVSTRDIHVVNFSSTNPFPPAGLPAVPTGCATMSAMTGSGILITPNLSAYKDHTASQGTDYSKQRGRSGGNSITLTTVTLFMNTVSVQADAHGVPTVEFGVEVDAKTRRAGEQ